MKELIGKTIEGLRINSEFNDILKFDDIAYEVKEGHFEYINGIQNLLHNLITKIDIENLSHTGYTKYSIHTKKGVCEIIGRTNGLKLKSEFLIKECFDDLTYCEYWEGCMCNY